FSAKAKASIRDSDARLNLWHGSVRSGKTIRSIIRWLTFIREAPPGALLMVGKTERTLKRNILDELERIVGARNYRYVGGSGEAFILGRRVLLVGANAERAEGKIRGMTLAGAYGDELTLWPEGFFRMLLSRPSLRSARTLKRNILHELERIVGARNYRYVGGSGEAFILGRRVLLVGANDERAEGKIRGMTLAGAYGDELTLWPEGFFRMLLSRLSL